MHFNIAIILTLTTSLKAFRQRTSIVFAQDATNVEHLGCWRDHYVRTAESAVKCNNDEALIDGGCYKPCPPGYKTSGVECEPLQEFVPRIKSSLDYCPPDYPVREMNFCFQSTRGFIFRKKVPISCAPGNLVDGTCFQSCPPNTEASGALCKQHTLFRWSRRARTCNENQDQIDVTCFEKCKNDYEALARMHDPRRFCGKSCPSHASYSCGPLCAIDYDACSKLLKLIQFEILNKEQPLISDELLKKSRLSKCRYI